MAIKKGDFFTGVLGTVVFKKVNGKQIVIKRVAPGTMKQSEATKLWSNTFGMASAFAAQFRSALGFVPESYVDSAMTNRLTSSMAKILKACRDKETKLYTFQQDSFSGLTGFNFNSKSPVEKLLVVQPQLHFGVSLLEVWFPNLSKGPLVKFPKKSMRCKMTVNVTLFRLMDGLMSSKADQQSVYLLNDQEFVSQEKFTFTVPDGCLCVVTLFLEYAAAGKNDWRTVNDVNFNPCCILGAQITPGSYQNDSIRYWTDMVRFNE